MYLRVEGPTKRTVGAVYKKGVIKGRYVAITDNPFGSVDFHFHFLSDYDKFVKLNIKRLD